MSCDSKLEEAEKLYLKGDFLNAKKILSTIEKSDNNKVGIKDLEKKIDSNYFESAENQFKKLKLDDSFQTLKNLEIGSFYFAKKQKLLEKIEITRDSIHFQNALKSYSQNLLEKSISELKYINKYSRFFKDKNELLTKIKNKRKKLSKKESKLSKAVISSIFGTSTRKMKVEEKEMGIFYVTYYKDGKKWTNKVKFNGNQAEWGSEYGRWRSDDLYYSETKSYYFITEKYSDGSTRKDKFLKKSL